MAGARTSKSAHDHDADLKVRASKAVPSSRVCLAGRQSSRASWTGLSGLRSVNRSRTAAASEFLRNGAQKLKYLSYKSYTGLFSQHGLSHAQQPTWEAAPCIHIFMQIFRRPCRQQLADIAWNVAPSLIAESLAEIAQIAEITDDVGPALRWDEYPTLIGESLAETSVTGLGESIPSSALIQSPGSCFCTESAQSRYLMA
jgi:hypothetical protein